MAGEKNIMTPEETAQFLRKSLSWVYKNSAALGGRKLGDSLIFPERRELYGQIFGKMEGMEERLRPQGNQVHRSPVQDKKRSHEGAAAKKGGLACNEHHLAKLAPRHTLGKSCGSANDSLKKYELVKKESLLDQKEMLTQKEVADYFRVKEGTIINWRKKGLFSYWQAPGSGKVLYFSEEIRSFRDKNTVLNKGGDKPRVKTKREKPCLSANEKKEWRI